MPKQDDLSTQFLIELNKKMSSADIARYLATQGIVITPFAIGLRFKKVGYTPIRHSKAEEYCDTSEAIQLSKDGISIRKIAKKLGVHRKTVTERFKRVNYDYNETHRLLMLLRAVKKIGEKYGISDIGAIQGNEKEAI